MSDSFLNYIPKNHKKKIAQFVDGLISHLGYTRKSKTTLDFRGSAQTPLDALLQTSVITEVPLAKCRGLLSLAFPLTNTSAHPFVLTAKKFLDGELNGFPGSPLDVYYNICQPQNASEYLGVDNNDNPLLNGLSPTEATLPWMDTPGDKIRKKHERAWVKEAERYGRIYHPKDGWHHIGPVSKELGEFEFYRILKVTKSISKKGYDSKKKLIRGWFLYSKNSFAFIFSNGQHRASAMAALGYENIPMVFSLSRIISRDSVSTWPGVVSGHFSEKQALDVFDRIISGKQPDFMKERLD